MPVLKRVPVQWASIHKPNIQFEPQWEIQVTLTKEQAKELKEAAIEIHEKGIKFKKEENGDITYRFRRKVTKADGTPNKPPVVISSDGKTPFTANVGNGSLCNIQYSFSAYDNKFGKGVVNDLKGIQVITHVPFGVQDGEEFGNEEEDNEFSNETTTAPKSKSKSQSDDFDDSDFE